MRPSRVSESIHRCRGLATLVVASAALAVLAGSSVAEPAPMARACPSASFVKAAFHGKIAVDTPVVTVFPPYAKTCTYPPGTETKITFQVDTLASFLTSEKAAGRLGARITKVKGLGVAAWTTGLGSVYVFDGHESIQILALALEIREPITATATVEALAKQLLTTG
jgi:hypothetical protein